MALAETCLTERVCQEVRWGGAKDAKRLGVPPRSPTRLGTAGR